MTYNGTITELGPADSPWIWSLHISIPGDEFGRFLSHLKLFIPSRCRRFDIERKCWLFQRADSPAIIATLFKANELTSTCVDIAGVETCPWHGQLHPCDCLILAMTWEEYLKETGQQAPVS